MPNEAQTTVTWYAMIEEHKSYFMRRWQRIKESVESHPYAQWVTVIDPSCPAECRKLAGLVLRVDGNTLGELIYSHVAEHLPNCRCRLKPVSLATIEREHLRKVD